MKKLASVLGKVSGRSRGMYPGLYIAALLLPGGLAAMPVLWWLEHRRAERTRREP